MKTGHCLLCAGALALAGPAAGDARTYANPLDIDYRYNWEQQHQGISYRTGADPAIVRFQGAYYLFETLADGYWRSTDLIDWQFIKPSRWPFSGLVAPAVWPDRDRLIIWPSMDQPGSVLESTDPASGRIDFLDRLTPELPDSVRSGQEDRMRPGQIPPGPWDPALFRDDDGAWYLYWGSSNVFPIYGIPLDRSRALSYVGKARPLLTLDPQAHGWERFGRDNSGTLPDGTPIKPFIEGAWMTKVNGRYYLQYAAPGTEYNAYATGTYVADHPLGPFRYAPYNPVAFKPGGFMQGAGHGSAVQDAHGNWWLSGTGWVGANWPFERRIMLFPARFADDGQMIVSTRFGDFPHWMPDAAVRDPDALFTGWMLLSYRKPAVASSTLPPFGTAAATDEDPRTCWVAGANRPGETLTVDLGGLRTVRAVQVNFADYHAGRFADAPDIYTAFRLDGSTDGRSWHAIGGTGSEHRDRPDAYVELATPARIRFVRYVHGHVGSSTLAISDLRVFGTADGAPPRRPRNVHAARAADARDARISWSAEPGVVGYNIRWGIRPDRLTLTDQLFQPARPKRTLTRELRSLNVGQSYWVAVEAFNEGGVSRLSRIERLP